MLGLHIHADGLLVVYVLQLGHLDRYPLLGHSFHDLVQKSKHVGDTKVEGIVSSRQVVLRVALLILSNVELRVLDR